MDLEKVTEQAEKLLNALGRFSGFTDAYSLINLAHEQDVRWQSDAEQTRLNMQAIEFLQKVGLIRSPPGAYGYEVSSLGRDVLSSAWPASFEDAGLADWVETESIIEAMSARRVTSENGVDHLVVQHWRQFEDVSIVFHPRLTMLTGANGAGKTTLLNILGPHFNWSAQLLTRKVDTAETAFSTEIGHLRYSNGARTQLVENAGTGISSAPLQLPQMQSVPGLFINSHRSVSTYRALNALPSRFSAFDTLGQQFASEVQVRHSGGTSDFPPLYRMKEALVASAMYAYGNPAIRANASARDLWEGYQEVLKRFLPKSLGFVRLVVENADIVVVTETAEFPLEAVSGGISAMLELSWQIFLRRGTQTSFTVCIDEPENHLHPELQRSIMPSLLTAFPDVTFIVSTHSPLVVTSSQDSSVYALAPSASGKITSRLVENADTSASPDETLTSILGLDSTLPLWAESELQGVLGRMSDSPTVTEIRALQHALAAIGLDKQFPAAIRSLTGKS